MALDFIPWHGLDLNAHKFETAKALAKNYRTTSLSVYGEPNNPLFAAVMVKRAVVHPEEPVYMMTMDQLGKTIDTMWKKKFGLYVVSAIGPANKPLFTASFRPMAEKPIVRLDILNADDQLWKLNFEFWRDGYRPVWIDAYGSPDNTQLVAVWHRNTERIAWNIEAASWLNDLPTRQAIFNAVTTQGGRPTLITLAPGDKYLGLFVDNKVGSWVSRSNLTTANYVSELKTQTDAGRMPICVSGQGSGANIRYAAIFADREQPIDRVPTVTTTSKNSPVVKGIDDAMLNFMRAHSMRGCSLAIVKDTRLVYARGYTLAEPDYPVVKETTLFRQASVSKLFAAAAIYRLLELKTKNPDGTPFTLDTTLQTVLNLKIPPITVPEDSENKMDSRFKDIKIRHLLESISSIDQGYLWWHQQAAQSFGKPVPGTPAQLASFIAGKKLGTKNPGDTTHVVYGNVDYFMLSQVVAKLAKKDTFEQALDELVLQPLKIINSSGTKRVRGSVTLQKDQPADEARHHSVNIHPASMPDTNNAFYDYWRSLQIDSSGMTEDHPLAPTHYGAENYEIYDGCGGLSAAVTDIARLVASLNLQKNNPLLSSSMLETWFTNVMNATQTNTNPDPGSVLHGYHGFDTGGKVDPNKPILDPGNFVADKGGWLPSHSSYVWFQSGAISYIAASNSVGQSDVTADWLWSLNGVNSVAQAQPWTGIDLFPDYGMASFTSSKVNFPIGPIDPTKLPKHLPLTPATGVISQEQQSMAKNLRTARPTV